jgi:segregation and condensation protein B
MRSIADAWLTSSARTGLTDRPATGIGWRWQFATRADHSNSTERDQPSSSFTALRSRKLARVEAVLLVADGALSFRRLTQFATLADVAEARKLVAELNDAYDASECAFRVEHVASGCRLMTRPQFALWLDRLHNRQARVKLSPPMLETLSIVACRQPVTRAEIEKIRGVQASEMLKQLMERGLVRITGEDDSLGRPFLYGTTRQFLEQFGLGSLDDLPVDENLRRTRDTHEPIGSSAGNESDEPAAISDALDNSRAAA